MTGTTSKDPARWIHSLGQSRVQSENNRLTFPELIEALKVFSPTEPGEVAHWGYDPDRNFIMISNDKNELKRHVKHVTVSEGAQTVPKDFFDEFEGHRGGPVREEVRLEQGQEVYFIATDEMIDPGSDVKSVYVVPTNRICEFYETFR